MANDPIPTTLAPFLSVRNGAKAVDFYKSAFGAEEIYRLEDPTGAVVSNLTINGYGFWVADEAPEYKNFSPETLNGGTVRIADSRNTYVLASFPDHQLVRRVQDEVGPTIGPDFLLVPFHHGGILADRGDALFGARLLFVHLAGENDFLIGGFEIEHESTVACPLDFKLGFHYWTSY